MDLGMHAARFLVRGLAALVLLVVVHVLPVPAQETCPTAPLTTAPDFRINLGNHACALADETRALTLGDVLGGAARLAPVPGGLVDFGFGDSRFWVLVRVENTAATAGTWWVTHDIPVAEALHVTLVRTGGEPQELLSLTDADPFEARPIAHRHLVSEISLAAGETATLVVDYVTGQATEMPFFAETLPEFFRRTQSETVEIIALTALVLGMGVISTVYLYGLEGRPALAYGFYVLFGVALLIHMEGYSFQYVWPGWPGVNQVALAFIGLTSVALGTFFVERFTLSQTYHPRLHVVAVGLIGLLLALGLMSPWFLPTLWFKLTVLTVISLSTTTQVALAIAALRRGQSGTVFLVLGFGSLAVSITFGVLGYLTEGLFEQELAGRAIRFGFLFEAMFFSAAIALRVRSARRERDASLKAQLRLSEERLGLSEALRKAEDDRQRAASAAVRSQEALASTAHDIRQPLASLQMALSADDARSDRITQSLEYLEDIVRTGLEGYSVPLGTGDADPPAENARERFRASVVLKNIEAMFGAEAARQGIRLTVVGCSAHLVADPLALMRIAGNLVSNALQHSGAGRVLVGCRRRAGGLAFEVHDNGQGIPKADLARLQERGAKGDGSEGYGLGMSIILELADANGLRFDLSSVPGRGTSARIFVSAGAQVSE